MSQLNLREGLEKTEFPITVWGVGTHLHFYCQAQFQLSSSSVQFELRLALMVQWFQNFIHILVNGSKFSSENKSKAHGKLTLPL